MRRIGVVVSVSVAVSIVVACGALLMFQKLPLDRPERGGTFFSKQAEFAICFYRTGAADSRKDLQLLQPPTNLKSTLYT